MRAAGLGGKVNLVYASIDRRTFLGGITGVGVTAVAALAGGGRAAAAGEMFISMNGSLTPKKPQWPEFVKIAGWIGYGGADVDLAAAQAQGVEATKALFERQRIKPGIVSLPVRFGGDEPTFNEGMGRLEDACRFAAAIGCPRMMAVMPPASATPKDEFRKIVKDRMLSIQEVLARTQVRLGLEFLGPLHFRARQPHEFIWRMNDLAEFCKECGPNIGITLDAWHWHHAGATADDIVAAGKSLIVHVHVSDAKKQPAEEVRDDRRLMPGEGIIDLDTFFKSLKKIAYEDAVSPEPIGRVPETMTAEEGAQLGFDTTKAAMAKAGVICGC